MSSYFSTVDTTVSSYKANWPLGRSLTVIDLVLKCVETCAC